MVLRREDVEVNAICDIDKKAAKRAVEIVRTSRGKEPAVYTAGDEDFLNLVKRDAEGAGHGGMDFFIMHAFLESVKLNGAPPIDVYDAVIWSAISPLSEMSIANGSNSVDFPDFTHGSWKANKPIFGLTDDY